MKKITILLILLSVVCFINAQSLFEKPIRSVGMGIGWYNPTLQYINDKLTDPNYHSNIIQGENGEVVHAPYNEELKGTFMTNAMVEFNLYSPAYLRLSAGHWSQQVTKDEVDAVYGKNAFEKTKITLIPVTADIIFNLPFLNDFITGTQAYVGAGAGMCFIDEQVDTYAKGKLYDSEERTSDGQDVIFHALVGVEQPLFNTNFSYKIEYDAVFGKYDKTGTNLMNNTNSTEELSMGGFRISANLVYRFK